MPGIVTCPAPLSHADQRWIEQLLAESFGDDEAMLSMVGRRKWQRIAPRYFRFQFPHADHVLTTPAHQGVLLARSPDLQAGWQGFAAFFKMAWLLGMDYPASQRIAVELSHAMPSDRHWYINQLAVKPALQSQGIGRALLDGFLPLCGDTPVYVDCAMELRSFYAASGFHAVQEFPGYNLLVMAAND